MAGIVRIVSLVAVCALAMLALDGACAMYVAWQRESTATVVAQPGQYRQAESLEGVFDIRTDAAQLGASERLAADRKAKEYLRHWEFFRDGRGVHSSPAAAWWYDAADYLGGWKRRLLRERIADQVGVIVDESGQVVGFEHREHTGVTVVALGCAVCHVGKVLGQIVPGLGNKNIDPYLLASRGGQFAPETADSDEASCDAAGRLEQATARFCNKVADERLGNLTQGMVPVAVSWRWFYEQAGRPVPPDMGRGAVKVPAVWGYGAKRSVGRFCDGTGDGQTVGWAALLDLLAGQRPESVRAYRDELEEADAMLADLLPPAYPLAIDAPRARRGKALFSRHCMRCHGRYEKDAALLPLFRPPKRIPIELVGTDGDRLAITSRAFLEAVRTNPLGDLMQAQPVADRPGYFAPRLEGVWSRFPYLHNGSVPNVAALLSPPDERPRAFSLRDAGEVYRFDPQRLGLTAYSPGSAAEAELIELGQQGRRDVYLVTREGHSNAGHAFGTTLSEAEKAELIEYLKTL